MPPTTSLPLAQSLHWGPHPGTGLCPAAERLDVIRDDMPAMLRVIRKMGLADVAAVMEDELSMVRYYWHSKQTKDRSDDPAPRRWETFTSMACA